MVKIIGITFLFLAVFCISACGKRCKDAEDNARTKPKDAALMYIWRFTDNLIVKKSSTIHSDSGFISFKPNGDFMDGATIKSLNAVPYVWYVNNNIIVRNYCSENIPSEGNIGKYLIRNDTLFLNPSSDGKFLSTPETYVHHWKY